jgi:hypothetical protein
MKISNNSTDTIAIYFSGTTAYVNGIDTVRVLPNQDTIYYDKIGTLIKTKNFECDPQILANEVSVIASSGRTFIKDMADPENWTCETDSKNTYWKMIFYIDEADLR